MSPCDGLRGGASLATWLCAAVFDIPPLPQIQVAGFLGYTVTVEIDNLRCSHVHVGQLTSLARVVGDAPNLTLGLADLSLNCNTSEVKVKLEMNDGETQAEMLVQGVKEDLERMARMMDLQERGKVRIRGIFEDAANGAPSGGGAAPAAPDAAAPAAPPVSSE